MATVGSLRSADIRFTCPKLAFNLIVTTHGIANLVALGAFTEHPSDGELLVPTVEDCQSDHL